MEAGESPARSRHCNEGAAVYRDATAKRSGFAGRRTAARISESGNMHEPGTFTVPVKHCVNGDRTEEIPHPAEVGIGQETEGPATRIQRKRAAARERILRPQLFYYVGNIVNDISGITRKSAGKNRIGEVGFLIETGLFIQAEQRTSRRRPVCCPASLSEIFPMRACGKQRKMI